MAYLVSKGFLDATQDCFENAITTGILQLANSHPDLDRFSGHAFLDKKKLWTRTNKGFCVRFSPQFTCMTSALVRGDAEIPDWLLQRLRQICQTSIQIALQFQRTCLAQHLYNATEVDEDSLEILDGHQLSLERGVTAGIAYRAGTEAVERSNDAAQILNDPFWNRTLESTNAPGNGLVTNLGELSGNPNCQGFAAEFQVINGFNAQAAASESPYRAVSTESFGGSTSQNSPDIQIIDLRTGDVVDEIQVKSGGNEYVSSSIDNNRYGDMHKLHNLEAGTVDGGSQTYTSPDQRVQVSFTQEEAQRIARDPHGYVDDQRTEVQHQMMGEKVTGVAHTLTAGAMAGAGMSAVGGFAECLGAIARGDNARSETILKSIPDRVKDGAMRSLGRAGFIAAAQALVGANPLAAGAGVVGVDMVRCFGSVLNGQQTPEEAFRDATPRTLGTMATVSLCMANPAVAIGIIGYRFAYGFISSYAKATTDTTLSLRTAS
ncbi:MULTISPECIES: hypothetical protein [unclassified Synechococcus]|uniref:hypothetical protein n=1 Tax=unclassified Synechococcus TaxID=2626047 RepID=UPI002AD51B11|nr:MULTISPECIES: hypothetical protein [unclassified Synechococcus]